MRILAALLSGLVFGLGITVSGMINPSKVLNFFDISGNWDPSLALVMAAALVTTFVGYRLVLGRAEPLFDSRFHLPGTSKIDTPLLAGSAIYGIGWGLIGYCPGGVVPALGLGRPEPWIFVAALIGGMAAARAIRYKLAQTVEASGRGSA